VRKEVVGSRVRDLEGGGACHGFWLGLKEPQNRGNEPNLFWPETYYSSAIAASDSGCWICGYVGFTP
jgi:hypothetical protein